MHKYLLHTYAHAYIYMYVHTYIHVRVCHAFLTEYACCRRQCEIEAVRGEGLRKDVPGNSLAAHVLAEPCRTRAALWPATVQSCWQPLCSNSAGNRAVAAASMLMLHAKLELWNEMIKTGMSLCVHQRPLTPLPEEGERGRARESERDRVPRSAIPFQYVLWNFAAQCHAPRPPPFHTARSGVLPGTQSLYPCSAVRCRRPPADRGIASEDEETGQHGDAAGQGPRCHGRIAVEKKQPKTQTYRGTHRAHGSLHAGVCGARGYVKVCVKMRPAQRTASPHLSAAVHGTPPRCAHIPMGMSARRVWAARPFSRGLSDQRGAAFSDPIPHTQGSCASFVRSS